MLRECYRRVWLGASSAFFFITPPTLTVLSASPVDGVVEVDAKMEGKEVMVDDEEGDEDEEDENEVEEEYVENEEVADAGEWSGSTVHGWNLAGVV